MLQLCAQALKAAANQKPAKKLGSIFIAAQSFDSSSDIRSYHFSIVSFLNPTPTRRTDKRQTPPLKDYLVFPPLLPTCNTFVERCRRLVSTPGLQLVKVCLL